MNTLKQSYFPHKDNVSYNWICLKLEWIYFNQLPEYNIAVFTTKLEKNPKNIIKSKNSTKWHNPQVYQRLLQDRDLGIIFAV